MAKNVRVLKETEEQRISESLIRHYSGEPDQDRVIFGVTDGGPPLSARYIVESLRDHDSRVERMYFGHLALGMEEEPLDDILASFAFRDVHSHDAGGLE